MTKPQTFAGGRPPDKDNLAPKSRRFNQEYKKMGALVKRDSEGKWGNKNGAH